MTWGAGGSTSELTMDLCCKMKKEKNVVPNMHLTCTNVVGDKISKALQIEAKENGVTGNRKHFEEIHQQGRRNGRPRLAVTCALDLIKYIRKEHGDFFHITCAGYPEGDPKL